MIDKGINRLTATRLRMILIGTIVGTGLIIGVGFYFIQSFLYSYAVEVSHASENASTSAEDIATFTKLQQKLNDDEITIKRVADIVGDSKLYEYQDQIIADLNAYAKRSGVAITSYTFASSLPQTQGGGASAGTSGATASTAAPIAGLNSTAVSIALAAPLKYNNLMHFVHAVEQNLTKMQIGTLSMARGATKDEVTINSLELEVYIK